MSIQLYIMTTLGVKKNTLLILFLIKVIVAQLICCSTSTIVFEAIQGKTTILSEYGCIKRGCTAKLNISADHDPTTIVLREEHTCDQLTHKPIERTLFVEECKRAIAQSVDCSTRAAFDNVSLKNERNKKLAGKVSYKCIQRTLQRHKSKKKGPGIHKQYSSLKALHDHLKENLFLLKYKIGDGEASVETVLISSSSKTDHIFIFDAKLMNEFNNNNDLFVDGTFNVRPNVKNVAQLLTIMCKKHDIVVPCAWVLMSRRTTKAYKAVWSEIKRKFPLFKPHKAICDYEKALIKSLRESFDGITVQGCYFHFSQAIIRKAKSKSYRLFIKNNQKENPDGHRIIKQLLTLPLLPVKKIEEGLNFIIQDIVKIFENNKSKLLKWEKFINEYFRKEWMDKITPNVFSVFNAVDRTNNFLESYHRKLNELLRTKPSTYTFFYVIITIKEKSLIDLERARLMLATTVGAKAATRKKNEIIKNAWMAIESPAPWTTEKFIRELTSYELDIFDSPIQEDQDDNAEDTSLTEDSDEEEDDFKDFNYETSICETENIEITEEVEAQSEKKERKLKTRKRKISKVTVKNIIKTEESTKLLSGKRKRLIKKNIDPDYYYH